MKTLLKYVQFLGIHVINGCRAKHIEDGKRASVICEHSILNEEVVFSSGQVIVCANAFTQKLFPDLTVKPGRGQIIVTKPIKGLKLKGVYHYDEGYYYFRNYGERIILGGGRNLDFTGEETTDFELNPKIINDLEDKLQNIIIPGINYEIEDRWTGIMGFTEDRLPLITKISENIIAAISCNGMGMALSSLVARKIAEELFKQND
jgi:glycine/D-amino acid oxidase-like deaminating enzyme